MKKRDAKIIALEICAGEIKYFIDQSPLGDFPINYSEKDSEKIYLEMTGIMHRLMDRAEILKQHSIEKQAARMIANCALEKNKNPNEGI